MDGRPSGDGFGLVGTDELDVMAITKDDAMLGVRYGISRSAKVRWKFGFANNVVDAVLKHGADFTGDGDGLGKVGL